MAQHATSWTISAQRDGVCLEFCLSFREAHIEVLNERFWKGRDGTSVTDGKPMCTIFAWSHAKQKMRPDNC